jgi:hypothetical protein
MSHHWRGTLRSSSMRYKSPGQWPSYSSRAPLRRASRREDDGLNWPAVSMGREDAGVFADLVRLREEVLGAEHPDTLIACGNLAGWTGWAEATKWRLGICSPS